MQPRPFDYPSLLSQLLDRRDLDDEQVRWLLREVMSGRCAEGETAALLIGLRMKGESGAELAAAASVLREFMVRFETGRDCVLDTCGTGGDGVGTFNISTAAALVAAGAGVSVVKHGNRAVSSQSGSADVLAALGVRVKEDASWARRCLEEAGLAFCFAPHFHPAMRHVGALRRRLGVRTLFNCLGPLANPAGALYQVLGVGHAELLDPLADALRRLGTRHALLVCGRDGLDEVTLTAPTQVREVRDGRLATWEWTADDFGLPSCTLADLRVNGPEASAARIRAILEGENSPSAWVVMANAAAALLAADRVQSSREGVALARQTIANGSARRVLERLIGGCESV
jgi:anthranilate phosphoribosyltransferase